MQNEPVGVTENQLFREIQLLRNENAVLKAKVAELTAHNRQSAPCLHVESLFVNKAGFDECRICGHVFRN